MTQTPSFDFPPSPWSGSSALPAIELMLKALRDCNSGPTAPPNPVPWMLWRDTSVAPAVLRVRNAANTAWPSLLAELGISGVGAETIPDTTDLNAITRGGTYQYPVSATGNPLAGSSGTLLHLPTSATTFAQQVAWPLLTNRMFIRQEHSGVWQPWVEVLAVNSSGNLGLGGASTGQRLYVNSGAIDEVARFEGTGNPFISLFDSGARQFFISSDSAAVILAAEASKSFQVTVGGLSRLLIDTAGQIFVSNPTQLIAHLNSAVNANDIGSYIFAQTTGADVARGGLAAGSTLQSCSAASRNLQETNTAGQTFSNVEGSLTGTWRCMGTMDFDFTRSGNGPTAGGATLWLRIA